MMSKLNDVGFPGRRDLLGERVCDSEEASVVPQDANGYTNQDTDLAVN